jgi:hypothetical protein
MENLVYGHQFIEFRAPWGCLDGSAEIAVARATVVLYSEGNAATRVKPKLSEPAASPRLAPIRERPPAGREIFELPERPS